MFWIICDPSSGSIEVYLTENIRSGSLMFVVCLVSVCVYVVSLAGRSVSRPTSLQRIQNIHIHQYVAASPEHIIMYLSF